MPFPIVFTSSAPAGGRKASDFSGPILLGKLADNGPVGLGPTIAPSGTLFIQSTGGQSNQTVSTAAVANASLLYVPVTTGDIVGGGPPPFTGFGAAMVLVDTVTPHISLWSTRAAEWITVTSTVSGTVLGAGTINAVIKWASTDGLLTSANMDDDGTNITITSSVNLIAPSITVTSSVNAQTLVSPFVDLTPTVGTAPAADPTALSTGARLYAWMSSSGKTEVRVLFPSGTSQVIARED